MSHYSYPLNDERERMLDQLEAETDANTRADAIDTAIRHYLEDKANRKEHWDQIPPEVMRLLNTSELKVSYYPKVR
jgi:metal-responsive CopG/Arc/MetJ family transcriptional regulator